MPFSSSADLNFLQSSDTGVIDALGGDDRYVLSSALLSNNQKITIQDSGTGGSNTLQLVGGLVIVSSQATADALLLTLNNGAVITLLGASSFKFITGGDAVTGSGGTTETYSAFLTASLGYAAVPAAGALPVSGGTKTINATGGTGPATPGTGGVGQTFTLTTGADISGTLVGSANSTSTDGNDTFTATQATYNANDVVIGGNGTDTLTVTSNAAIINEPTVAGVETITFNIATANLAPANVALGGIASGEVTVNQLQAGAAVTSAATNVGSVTLNFGTGITGATTVDQKTGASTIINAGSSTAVTVISGGTGSATVNGGALTTVASVTMATTGTAAIAGDKLATITSVAKTATLTTKNATSTINIDGTGAADTATVSIGAAASLVNGAANAAEILNISTGTTQLTAGVATPSVATISQAAATTYNLSGANAITLANTQALTVSLLSGKTVASTATGAAKVEQTLISGSALAADFTKVATSVAIDIKGTANLSTTFAVANGATVNAAANLTADLEINGVLATAATNVLNLGVSAGQTAGITVTNTKTINMSVTADSSINVLAAGTADVFVTGTKALTLASTSVAAKLDATNLSGVLTATAGAATIKNIIGGSGADVITLTTNEAVTVEGGLGNDTLNLKADNTKAVFTGFEVVQMVDGNNLVNASQFSGKVIAVKGLNGSGGTGDDVLSFNKAATSIDVTTIDLSKLLFDGNVSSVAIDGSALGTSIALGNALTITGSSLSDNINLSTNVGANTINGGAGADTIIGGTGVDTIIGGEGADTITGGAGADVIDLTEAVAAVDVLKYNNTTDSKSGAQDVVTGYGKGSDTIDLSAAANGAVVAGTASFAVAANVGAVAGTTNGIAAGLFTFDKVAATSLADAIAKVGADVATVDKAVVFNFGGDAYLFVDSDGAATTANDMVIKLVGVTAASVAATGEVFTVS